MKKHAVTLASLALLTACSGGPQPAETTQAAPPTPEESYLAQVRDGTTINLTDEDLIEQGTATCDSLLSMVNMGAKTSDGEPIGVNSGAIRDADLHLHISTRLDREDRDIIMLSATDNLCPEAYDHMDDTAKSTSPYREYMRD